MIEDDLPNTPSGLLRLALADLERVEADPRYRVNMLAWHDDRGADGRCEVCLAGAVMAKSLGVGPAWHAPIDLGEPLMHKMQAIDLARRGRLREAAWEMGLTPPDSLRNRPNGVTGTAYSEDPAAFKADIAETARILEEAGL